MSTDMLEMILSRQPSRLTERVSKFIIYQVKTHFFDLISMSRLNMIIIKILIALMKLHSRNIAHCKYSIDMIITNFNEFNLI